MTPTRLTVHATSNSSSAAARLSSSRVATARVSVALSGAMLVQIQANRVTAEASHPVSTASCHGAANAVATATMIPIEPATMTRIRSDG